MIKKILLYGFFAINIYALDSVDLEDKLEMGQELYEQTCISCHGVDGKANTNMQLVVKPRDLTKTLLDKQQIYNIIKDGAKFWGSKADIMPAFKYVFNEEQLEAITYYIVTKFNPNREKIVKELLLKSKPEPKNQDKKMAKWGKKIYNRNCKFCHGEQGHGDGVATKNPVDSIYPYDLSKTTLTKDQMFLYVKYGGKKFGAYKNDMPSWSKKYNDFKLHSVVKYVDEVIKQK